MFLLLPRDCALDNACSPIVAMASVTTDPSDVDPSEQNSTTMPSPPGSDKPGPYRFIGVGMVAGLILLVLVLWVALGSWPRRVAGHFGCGKSRRKAILIEENEEKSGCTLVTDEVIPKPEKAKTHEANPSQKSRRYREMELEARNAEQGMEEYKVEEWAGYYRVCRTWLDCKIIDLSSPSQIKYLNLR